MVSENSHRRKILAGLGPAAPLDMDGDTCTDCIIPVLKPPAGWSGGCTIAHHKSGIVFIHQCLGSGQEHDSPLVLA